MSQKMNIEQMTENGQFELAYREISSQIGMTYLNPELLSLSRQLSSSIRNRCMDLSCSRATDGSPEVFELEALLRKVIQINGEGIYG